MVEVRSLFLVHLFYHIPPWLCLHSSKTLKRLDTHCLAMDGWTNGRRDEWTEEWTTNQQPDGPTDLLTVIKNSKKAIQSPSGQKVTSAPWE